MPGRTGSPAFSLIVPTVGRTAEVAALLESLCDSTFKDFDVTIVDQNLDGRLDAICREFSGALSITHLKVDFRGAARARNFGARHATGKVINFPDDDCEVLDRALGGAQSGFQRVGLKVLIGMAIDRQGRASTTRFKKGHMPLSLWTMWGRNIEFTMFFDRETFLDIGGFDEEFGVGSTYGSEEGAELLVRMLRKLKSGSIVYDQAIRFYHPDKVGNYSEESLRRSFSYARGTGALVAKWPLLQVWCFMLGLAARTLVALAIFRGRKRQYYLQRAKGLVSGFKDYRQAHGGPATSARTRSS